MKNYPTSPSSLIASIWSNRELCYSLIKRDVIGRYKGSAFGVIWSFFYPLSMLAIYTFFFGFVFRSRWAEGTGSKAEFAIILFAGLIIFNLFSDCVSKAPSIIAANPNYVKKIVFPLEILSIVIVGSALFHFAISLAVWLLFYIMVFGFPPWTILLLPLILAPYILFILGATWILTSLGVLIKDLNHIIGLVTTSLMFTSPVFFPLSSIPEPFRFILYLNPMTWPIEAARGVMLWHTMLPGLLFLIYGICSCLTFFTGFFVFQKLRNWFSDIV